MTTPTPTNPRPDLQRRRYGTGSLRQRSPGTFELRLRSTEGHGVRRQRSLTVHGTRTQAEAALADLIAATTPDPGPPPPALITISEVLDRWLIADHPWRPSTRTGYRSTARFLLRDPLGGLRAHQLTPATMRTTLTRWATEGATPAVLGGRFRVLRSALSWAHAEALIKTHPIRHMRGPGRVPPRRPLEDTELRRLLATAETRMLEAIANQIPLPERHRRGQDLLLVRLAADTGARRGELAALRLDDLDGRVLRIERAESGGHLTTPKSGHGRVLTLGAGTARLWAILDHEWTEHAATQLTTLGPWLFTADPLHTRRLSAGALGHRFADLRDSAKVPHATLHRLRHQVATFLVARGEILQAQARLGHADAATTLREYAYALPLTDRDAADALDHYLDTAPAHDTDQTGPPTRRAPGEHKNRGSE